MSPNQEMIIVLLERMGPSFDPDIKVSAEMVDNDMVEVSLTDEDDTTYVAGKFGIYATIIDPVTGGEVPLVAFEQKTDLGVDRQCVFYAHSHTMAALLEAGSGAWVALGTPVDVVDEDGGMVG